MFSYVNRNSDRTNKARSTREQAFLGKTRLAPFPPPVLLSLRCISPCLLPPTLVARLNRMASNAFLQKILGFPILGTLEYYLRPSLRRSFGGPFNGQTFRRKIYHELLDVLRFDAIIECGTYRGATTGYLHETSGVEVDTVEAEPRYFGFSRTRHSGTSKIRTHLGDSRTVLKRLVQNPRLAGKRVFVYLDAHWGEDLPLREELEILFTSDLQVVALVDDFCVPGDDGYGFDNYGPGKTLEVDYLNSVEHLGLRRFFPTLRSEEETGSKRGCLVISKDSLAEEIATGCKNLWEDIASTSQKLSA